MTTSREEFELQQKRTKEIHELFDRVKHNITAPAQIAEQVAFESERARLVGLVSSKYGAEMYDKKFLNLQEILKARKVEELRLTIDTYVQAAKFYEDNYKVLNDNINKTAYIRKRLSTGRLDNWKALLERQEQDVHLDSLQPQASTILIMDVLTHTNPETLRAPKPTATNVDLAATTLKTIEDGIIQQAITSARQRDKEANDKKTQNELQEAQIIIPLNRLEDERRAQQALAEKRQQELEAERKVKAENEKKLQVMQIEEDEDKEVVDKQRERTIEKIQVDEGEAQVKRAAEAAAMKSYQEAIHFKLQEEEIRQKEKTAEEKANKAYAENIRILTCAIDAAIHNYTFWTTMVAKHGDAPKVPWVKDNNGNAIKVPTGIYLMLKFLRDNPIDYKNFSPSAAIKILLELIEFAKQRLKKNGFFSTRRQGTNGFYHVLDALGALLSNDNNAEFNSKFNLVMDEIKDYQPQNQNQERALEKIKV